MYLHTRGGGHRAYVLELADPLSGLMDCAVITTEHGDSSTGVRLVEGISAIDTSLGGLRRVGDRIVTYLRQPSDLRRVLEAESTSEDIDICHLQELPSILPSRLVRAARDAGYVVVVTVHNVTPHTRTAQDRLRFAGEKRAWAKADRCITHSEALGRQLVAMTGIPTARVGVVPHPIWPAKVGTATGPKSDFLFFGHLRPNKGLDSMLEALSALGDPSATIRGSGSKKMIERIQGSIRRLRLSNCDFRPGFVPEPDIPQLFASHKVLVCPYTHFDAQSGVTHLAASYSLPTVVTKKGALADLNETYGLGEVVDADTSTSLAAAMARAAERSGCDYYTKRFERAQRELSPRAVAELLVKEYEIASYQVRA